ncbi:hypothetical protein Q5H93_14800 [Hymenobacter sp. ASUV-10]|uniref:Uncharacterized protein n=1 Tax=Hymenobacter aranciens TaxID=3063996 RepID=A0ABT9BE07_9BACT|nr:hypothetical protein [Hymenobacter sp. ASUV-10]MDO7876010.1 hypothetical protein [Hymenobacter sp. ASUV-10]
MAVVNPNPSEFDKSVSSRLGSLAQAPQQPLAGYAAAWYLPQEDLVQEPVVVGGQVVGDLVLASGAGWRVLPHTRHTLKFDEKPKPERGSTIYHVKLQAERPTPTPAVLGALAGLERRRLLLLVQEHSGARRLVGSRDEYLRLLSASEGQHPGTHAGLSLELSGETTRLAPYYAGALVVLDGEAPGADAVGSGVVEVRDKAGRLMATVPAGNTLIITSGFRVALSIQ